MSTETKGPALEIVKPEKKSSLEVDSSLFFKCLDADWTTNESVITVKDGVYYFDGALSEEECLRLRSTVDMSASLSFWNPQGREAEDVRRFRDADTIELNAPSIANLLWKRLRIIMRSKVNLEIFIENDETDPEWERELVGNWIPTNFNHDLLFARYPSGGAFAPHTDGRAVHNFNFRSFYSVIVFLNTIPVGSGGGTRFYMPDAVNKLSATTNSDGKVHWSSDPALSIAEVDAVAGRFLIFHQAMVHEGVPPVSPHMKYIIRSDVMMSRTPAICDSAGDREAYRMFKHAEDLAEDGKVDEAVPLFKKALRLSPEMARIMGQG